MCAQSSKARNSINIHHEWKHLEKKNQAYKNLIRNMPAFTKIFKENILLRTEISKPRTPVIRVIPEERKERLSEPVEDSVVREKILEIKKEYQELILGMERRFGAFANDMQEAYEELEAENKMKDDRIKELRKRK